MRSLSSRITLWYAFAATLTAGVFMFTGRFLIEESYIEGIDQLNDAEFEEIRPRIEKLSEGRDEESIIQRVSKHTELDASLFFFQIGRSHHGVFFKSANLGGHELPEVVHGHDKITVVDEDLGKLRVSEYTVDGYDIHIASSLEGLYVLLGKLFKLGAIGLVATFLGSVLVGRLLSRIALKPITKIERTAARIDADNLGERIDIEDTQDEVSRLARLLNRTFERLERSFEEVRRFTAEASHELKTPLSLIRLNAESMSTKSEGGELRKMAENQVNLVDDLNKVVGDLLLLAKADSGVLRLSVSEHAVENFVDEFAVDAGVLCEDRGLHFEHRNLFEGNVSFDLSWMRQVWFNLVSNAIRFSPEGGTIELKSYCEQDNWIVEIRDEGPGIEESKLQRVFERFYSAEDPKGGKGVGLGLPLCQSIARLHHGSIDVSNRNERSGIVVTIVIPMLREDES